MGTEPGQRITESALRKKLAVSKVSLWNWRKAGMPVVSAGIRGRENIYNLDDVVAWLTRTGHGMKTIDTLARIGALLDQQAAAARPTSTAAAAKSIEAELAGEILGWMFETALIPWAALMVSRGADVKLLLESYLELNNVIWELAYDRFNDENWEMKLGETFFLLCDERPAVREQEWAVLVERIQQRVDDMQPENRPAVIKPIGAIGEDLHEVSDGNAESQG